MRQLSNDARNISVSFNDIICQDFQESYFYDPVISEFGVESGKLDGVRVDWLDALSDA